MLVGRFPTGNQRAPGEVCSPCQPDTGQEEGDAPAAGHVVHDVRERYVPRADGDPGGRDPDRGLDDRLPVGQLAVGGSYAPSP